MKDETPQKPQIILEQNEIDRMNGVDKGIYFNSDSVEKVIYFNYEGGSKWIEQTIYEDAYCQAYLKRKRLVRAYIRKRFFIRLFNKILGLFAK